MICLEKRGWAGASAETETAPPNTRQNVLTIRQSRRIIARPPLRNVSIDQSFFISGPHHGCEHLLESPTTCKWTSSGTRLWVNPEHVKRSGPNGQWSGDLLIWLLRVPTVFHSARPPRLAARLHLPTASARDTYERVDEELHGVLAALRTSVSWAIGFRVAQHWQWITSGVFASIVVEMRAIPLKKGANRGSRWLILAAQLAIARVHSSESSQSRLHHNTRTALRKEHRYTFGRYLHFRRLPSTSVFNWRLGGSGDANAGDLRVSQSGESILHRADRDVLSVSNGSPLRSSAASPRTHGRVERTRSGALADAETPARRSLSPKTTVQE